MISSDGGDSWKLATTDDIATPWLRLAANSPELSDNAGWNDAANYSTIQNVVVRDELYLLARADRGMQTWRFDAAGATWSRLVKNIPEWADDGGWDKPEYYSTIQTAVVGNELFLLARAANGMQTWKFDGAALSQLVKRTPEWADDGGWDKPEYYSTIQTAVVGDELFLLARAANGMQTWKFDGAGWSQLVKRTPGWADDGGWDKPQYYLTIQTAVVGNELFLLGRAGNGMQTWKFDGAGWSQLVKRTPEWADEGGWDKPEYYSTIQTAVVGNELFLLAVRQTACKRGSLMALPGLSW